MGDHVKGVDLVLLYQLEQMLPVLLDGRLAIANQSDACLHDRTNVEMVCLIWSDINVKTS